MQSPLIGGLYAFILCTQAQVRVRVAPDDLVETVIRIERRSLKTRTIMMIGVATWLGLTAFFFGLSVKITNSPSGWLGEHSGAIIWPTLGIVSFVGVVVGVRDRRLGITPILALAAAFLCFLVILAYVYSQLHLE